MKSALLPALVAALIALSPGRGAEPQTQLRLFTPAWRDIGTQSPQEVAKKFTVIFGHLPPKPFHEGNPAAKCFKYTLGPYAYAGTLKELPREALASDEQGRLVKAAGFANWLVVPDNPRWLEYLAKTVPKLMDSDYDGLFVDSMGTAPVGTDYLLSKPINPHTGRPYTKQEWLAAELVMLETIKAAMPPGKLMVLNGLSQGERYWTDPETDSPRILLPWVQGAMAEQIWREPRSKLTAWPSLDRWTKEVRMIQDVERRGLMGFWWTKCWTDGNTSNHEPDAARLVPQWRRFALASYLFAAGPHSYFNFDTVKNDQPKSNAAEAFPEYDAPLGTATGAGEALGETGVYARRFTRGLVLVNPTAAAVAVVTVPWGDAMAQPLVAAGENRRMSFPLSLPAHTGLILTRE